RARLHPPGRRPRDRHRRRSAAAPVLRRRAAGAGRARRGRAQCGSGDLGAHRAARRRTHRHRRERNARMTRPITLFTGQWADLPFEEVCRLASGWGYDGLEIACWGDHLDVERAANDDSYVQERLEILKRHNLQLFAISNHLNGQAVCDDPIDERHKGIVHPRVWGDGDPEGVRRRAAEEMKLTARAARKLGVDVVVGFTGSKIWKTVAMFPPAPESMIADGYTVFATRWN